MSILDDLAHLVLTTTSDAIVAADRDGLIRFWNPGAERIFGFSSAEAVGQSLVRTGEWFDHGRHKPHGRLLDGPSRAAGEPAPGGKLRRGEPLPTRNPPHPPPRRIALHHKGPPLLSPPPAPPTPPPGHPNAPGSPP